LSSLACTWWTCKRLRLYAVRHIHALRVTLW
jgi:hypothetical protein